VGSSLFLKKRFGVGYTLTVFKDKKGQRDGQRPKAEDTTTKEVEDEANDEVQEVKVPDGTGEGRESPRDKLYRQFSCNVGDSLSISNAAAAADGAADGAADTAGGATDAATLTSLSSQPSPPAAATTLDTLIQHHVPTANLVCMHCGLLCAIICIS
jgi:hypothetical protein